MIVFSRSNAAVAKFEGRSKAAFNSLYDRYRHEIGRLNEKQRTVYDRLRSASTTPEAIEWRLQDTIDFRRARTDPSWDKHLYIEGDGQFRAELGTWEAGVLSEELSRSDVVGWLRNLDRKPWSLEIPYKSAGKATPMFPDLLIVREVSDSFRFDVLEPHGPNHADNVEKAKGLAEFAERHGDQFDRIELIRNAGSSNDQTTYSRLDMNQSDVRDQIRHITTHDQLDVLFSKKT